VTECLPGGVDRELAAVSVQVQVAIRRGAESRDHQLVTHIVVGRRVDALEWITGAVLCGRRSIKQESQIRIEQEQVVVVGGLPEGV
jgi:hypothetical protein